MKSRPEKITNYCIASDLEVNVIILSSEMRQNRTDYEKFVFGKNATNVGLLGSLTLSGPTGGAYNMHKIFIQEKS